MDEPPKSSQEDVGYTIIKAALASIPVVGGAVAEFFQLLFAPPLAKRQSEYLEELARSVHALQKKYELFAFESLRENEVFISIAFQASQAAIKTHEKEKLQNLRNAVLNSVFPESPDYSEQQTFVRWVDEFTVWHIKLLKLFTRRAMPYLNLDDNDWRMNIAVDETFEVVWRYYPEMRSKYDLFLTILADLAQLGLIANIHPQVDEPSEMTQSPEITRLGKAFLKYLESPIDD